MDVIPAPDFARRPHTPISESVLRNSAAPSALTSISGTPELPTTAPIPQAQVYVELPTLTSEQRSRYRSILDREVPSEDEHGPVVLQYEYHDGSTLWYFAASGDNISHKYEAEDFRIKYPDLVDTYEEKKEQGTLDFFDPSSSSVHPKSRIKLAIKLNAKATANLRAKSRNTSISSVGEEWDNQSAEGEPEVDDEDFIDDETPGGKRRSTRTAAAHATKSMKAANKALPFSPKKTRRGGRAATGSDDSDGGTPVGRAAATRRSTRSRKSARANLADDEDAAAYEDVGSGDDSDAYDERPRRSGKSKGKASAAVIRRGRLSNPGYGRIRTVADFDYNPCDVDDPYTKPLRAHRGTCDKCHREPAHILIEKEERRARKGKPRKKRAKKDEDDEDDEEEGMDEMEKLESLGGWVQCLKCPLAAHWRCLASTQRDEIIKAARERDRQEWLEKRGKPEAVGDEADKAHLEEMKKAVPRRPDLTPYQMTEFTCSGCAKGGLCMVCLETALEPDLHSHKPLNGVGTSAQATTTKPSGAPQAAEMDVEMADGTQGPVASSSNEPEPPQETVVSELLFRCITCKRLAHYEHLPAPDEALGGEDGEPVDKVIIAEHYQDINEWQCADCASYSYRVDKIIAWRPFPPNAVDPTLPGEVPNVVAHLPREYLVKWEGRSYRRVQWVPHGWLAVKHRQKLVKFFREGPRLDLLKEAVKEEETANEVAEGGIGDVVDTDSRDVSVKPVDQPLSGQGQLDAMPDAERRIPPAWKTVDRVLDVMMRCHPMTTGSKSKKSGKASRKKVVDSDDEAEDDDPEALEQWDRAFDLGEQPDPEFMMPLDEWKEMTESDLVELDIDKVVWAFFKWDDLGYDEATWDSPPRKGEPGYPAYKVAFKRLVESQHVTVTVRTKEDQARYDDRKKGAFLKKLLKAEEHEQPVLGQSDQFKLMDFQIEGFNWLCNNWWDHQPSILADEMGLGKTVQISTFIGYIVKNYNAFPALIVVPNSTITNWVRELTRWAPALRVVPFYGEATSREIVKRYELTHSNPAKGTTGTKFHVLVTTYDTVSSRDFASVFKKVPRWEVLVVDEGQRLKNDSSILFRKLNELNIIHRIIMTGTPLNNNIRELFNLMNFLDPDQWNDLERLEKEHEELTEELIKDLHGKLRPYFLRRVKAEVLQLPPKNEVIVPVSLTPLQKEIYKGILSKNLSLLMNFNQSATKTKAPVGKTNMNNILMELRKCIQHPYLISQDLEPKGLQAEEAHEKLVDASAKLRLLKALLPKLRTRGHRVLLFSQFVIALDIIEDFLNGEGIKYLRLDGNTKQADRQKGMDEFNRPGSDVFVYLLSTRAGGVGINLWSADTVIIFDPDFNPHQDLQAIARSHRYGQTKPCLVFKLMAKGTAEERIMQAGKKKLALDHVIVQKMDEDGNEDVQSILTFGAKALFEEEEASQDIIYADHDVDKLIEKTEQEGDQEEQAKESGLTFSFAKVWAADKDSLEELENIPENGDQVDSWAQTLQRIASERAKTQAKEATGRGVRRKAAAAVKPQQNLDLDDTTPIKEKKTNKKRKKSKSVVSDDSDFHVPVSVSDDDSNVTPGISNQVSAAPSPPRQPSLELPTLPAPNGRRRAAPKDVLKTTINDVDICGLCGTSHTGPCYMTDSSENLADYRRMLLYDATDEPVEMRRAAIRIIDETLNKRGKANLIAGQPLHLLEPRAAPVPPPQPTPRTSISANGPLPSAPQSQNGRASPLSHAAPPSVKKHTSSVHQPAAGPSGLSSSVGAPNTFKRPSSPMADERTKKRTRREDGPACLICGKSPHHLMKDCPTIAEGPASISRAITRLDPNPEYGAVVNSLKKILRKQKKRMLDAEPTI